MKILSFDTVKSIERDIDQQNLSNLFQKNIVNNRSIELYVYIVPREHEMRLDKICENIYGSPDYIEELMVLNDIINPYSVYEGQYIFYCNQNLLKNLYTTDNSIKEYKAKRDELLKSLQKSNKASNEKSLPVTVMPNNLKQIEITQNHKIKIINKFK